MKELNLDLLENGIDFITSSIDPILNDSESLKLKYSIIHIAAGLELIIKERLRQEHWSLIFQDVTKATITNLESGDFVSVNFNTSLNRLKNICDVDINDKDARYLKDLKQRRNRIEHLKFKDNSSSIVSLIANILLFSLDFIEKHLDSSQFSIHTVEQIELIKKKTRNFEKFINLRFAKIKNELDDIDSTIIFKCPKCYQNALILNDKIECLFCYYTDSSERVADEYLEKVLNISQYYEVKSGGEYPLYGCLECNSQSLIINEDFKFCFNCKTHFEEDDYDFCSYCGGMKSIHELDDDICDDCNTNRWERFSKDNP